MYRGKRYSKRKPHRENKINDEIRAPRVRLIGDGEAEEVSSSEALRRAQEAGVDLVEIASGQDMPIVRIIDYGKFKFEKAKRDKENKKKAKVTQVKEVKIGPKTDVGDFDRKVREASAFLESGDNVKVSMRFRGREMAHTNLGKEKMEQFAQQLTEVGVLELRPILQGRMMSMSLRSKAKK